MRLAIIVLTTAALAGCATTTVTPVSKNQIIISTSADAECGASRTKQIASKMAAVETLRHGYERYIVVGANSANNVTTTTLGPTYAYTSGNAYNSYTTFGGQSSILTGSHDADLSVVMLNKGDAGFNSAIDAKRALGSDWAKLVKEGINSCT